MTHTPTDYNQRTLDEALDLAQLGIRIVPIKPGEKRPPMPAWQEAATTNESTIRKWYEGQYRGFGLGVATGELANGKHLFVLDIDEHDPAVSGSDTLHDLERANEKLPDTVEVHTGSGGKHLYFLSDIEIRNDAGKKLGPGLDIRGHNGQVLAPPTLHPNGERYLWAYDQTPWDIEIANAPQWLIDRLTDTPRPTTAAVIPARRDQFLTGDSIADTYNAETTWNDILTQDGWQLSHIDHSGEHHWTRPGKTTREGTSATTNYQNRDVLKVFTSSIPWLPEGAYSRFQYFSRRHHNADMSKAAKSLKQSPTVTHIAAKHDDEWPELIELTTNVTAPAFNISTMPDWIVDHAEAVAQDLEVSIDLPLALALGALSTAALGGAKVLYPRKNWTQPLNLYIAVALPPSTGKSPVKAAMFTALEKYEQTRIADSAIAVSQYDTEIRILKSRLKAAEELAAKGKGNESRDAMHEAFSIAAQIAEMKKPVNGKLLVDNVTEEALGIEMADAGGSIAMISAEGGLFDRMAGMYGNAAPSLDLYLEAWSGGRYSVSRVGRGSLMIPSGNLCIVTTVQPQILEEIGAQRVFAGRGLTQRFLLSIPHTTVGHRNRQNDSHTDEQARNTYDEQIGTIARTIATERPTIIVDGEASDLFAAWDQYHEIQLRQGGRLSHLAEWIGKVRASILRISALLHIAGDNPHDDHVSIETMRRALAIGDYYVAQQEAIADTWGTSAEILVAKRIFETFQAREITEFTAREIQRNWTKNFPRIEDVREPIEILIEHGYVRPLFDGPLVLGRRGKESPRFEMRPSKNGVPR